MMTTQKSRMAVVGALACALIPLPLLADSLLTETALTKTATEKPRVSFDGVLMLDSSSFDGVYGKGVEQTETELRRATLGMSAELAPTVELELSAQLEDGLDNAKLKDALLSWDITEHQQLTVGRQKEPMGLENNQSSKQIAGIERSMATELFAPDRHTGLVYATQAPRHTLAIGVFEADADSDVSGLAFSGRATKAVLNNDTQTVHLGASATHRDLGGTSLKLNNEGGVNLAANIIASKRRDVDTMQTVALEAAWLRGPLSVQGEWFQSDLSLAENAPDPRYSGSYIQGAWLFGSAHREYRNGSFKLSGLKKGRSAWEMVLRAEQADLRDADDGTQAETLLAGVNYYQGKNFSVMAALLTADTAGADVSDDPSGNAATLRVKYAF
ncbi:MAG: porin [Thiothrix litoralis]